MFESSLFWIPTCPNLLTPKNVLLHSNKLYWKYNPIIVDPVTHENATPYSSTSPSAYYKEVIPLPGPVFFLKIIDKEHFFQALVSHDSKLPDDVITPVLPPIVPSPSFPLPRIQRVQRGGSLENQSTSQGPVSTPLHFNKVIYRRNFEKTWRCG